MLETVRQCGENTTVLVIFGGGQIGKAVGSPEHGPTARLSCHSRPFVVIVVDAAAPHRTAPHRKASSETWYALGF